MSTFSVARTLGQRLGPGASRSRCRGRREGFYAGPRITNAMVSEYSSRWGTWIGLIETPSSSSNGRPGWNSRRAMLSRRTSWLQGPLARRKSGHARRGPDRDALGVQALETEVGEAEIVADVGVGEEDAVDRRAVHLPCGVMMKGVDRLDLRRQVRRGVHQVDVIGLRGTWIARLATCRASAGFRRAAEQWEQSQPVCGMPPSWAMPRTTTRGGAGGWTAAPAARRGGAGGRGASWVYSAPRYTPAHG